MTQEELLDEILDIFAGLRDGEIHYTPLKIQFALHTHICEIFNDTFAEPFKKLVEGKKLTKEELLELQSKLLEFEDCFNVKEAGELAKKVQGLIDEES